MDKDGVVTTTLNNLSIEKAEEVEIAFAECDPKHVTAAILTNDMHAYNTFEDPDKVHEEVFTEYRSRMAGSPLPCRHAVSLCSG